MGISSVSSASISRSTLQSNAEGIESKLKSAGLSSEQIQTTMKALNGGKDLGADGGSSTDATSSTSSSSSSNDVKQQIQALLTSLLSAAGVSEDQTKTILKAINGGKALGADGGTATSSSNSLSSSAVGSALSTDAFSE